MGKFPLKRIVKKKEKICKIISFRKREKLLLKSSNKELHKKLFSEDKIHSSKIVKDLSNFEKNYNEVNQAIHIDSFTLSKKKIKKEDKCTQTEDQIIDHNIRITIKNIDQSILLLKNKKLKNYKPKGLENFTANCYMNSLLQCFFYLKDFRQFFLENKFDKNQTMCQALKDVMIGLNANDNKRFFTPKKIKHEINKNNIFKDGEGSDVTDLLDFIFEKIILEQEKENFSDHTIRYQSKTYNKREMFNEIFNETNFNIIINKLFAGFYEKEFECENGHRKYSFQDEYRIIFSLEEISNFYKEKDYLTLYDCFEHNRRKHEQNSNYDDNKENEEENKIIEKDSIEESKENDKSFDSRICEIGDEDENFDKCNLCKEKYFLTEKIFQTPKILIILLDRGYMKRFDKIVKFDKIIDLGDYIDDELYEFQTLYQLTGVCIHHGKSGNYGHYTSICLCDDNKYYNLNDTHSKLVDNIDESNIGSPYILFYQRLDLTDEQLAIKECCSTFKRNINKLIKSVESIKGFIVEKKIEGELLKCKIIEKKKEISSSISVDFSKFNPKLEKPKITIYRHFILKDDEHEDKTIKYWIHEKKIKENQKAFKQLYDSYFKEFEARFGEKNKKCILY